MKSRKQRREEARLNKEVFEPAYKGRVITKAEYDKEVADLKEKSKPKTEKVETTEEQFFQQIASGRNDKRGQRQFAFGLF